MIRRVAAPDAALLSRLSAIHHAAFPAARGWSTAEIASLTESGDLFVAPDGFILTRTVIDETEVLTLAVDPAAQRRGIGGRLLDRALTHAPARVFLEVAADNTPALALYSARGFAEIARRAGYYLNADGTRTDALILQRR